MTITDAVHAAVLQIPASAWTPAIEPSGRIRDSAWVAELGGRVLAGWPDGMRLIVRKERPHPGAPLRFTDAYGMRLTCFATNTTTMPIAELELRHRRRARAENHVRASRATCLRNLPLHHSTEPALAGDRADRTEPAGLDADARPDRPRPNLGTSPPAAPTPEHRRTADHHRTPTHPGPTGALALDQPDHQRPGTPGGTAQPRLTSTNRPTKTERRPTGPVGPRPPEATSGSPA